MGQEGEFRKMSYKKKQWKCRKSEKRKKKIVGEKRKEKDNRK